MKRIIAILSFISGLWSCMPEPLPVELDEYEPKIVVASQVIPDYVMMVGLTKSFTVLSSAGYNGGGDSAFFESILVDSALVTIESASGTDTLIKLAPGLYASINELENPGGNYHLKVYDYDLKESVIASSTMLQNVPIDTIIPKLLKDGEDFSVDINVEFKDVKNEDNFYVMSVFSKNALLTPALDVNSFFNNGSNKIEYQELFDDRKMDGKTISKDLTINYVDPTDSLVVTLSNISEGYYSFLKSRERSGNLLSEITNEPINYPSNVNNGLGYFNTHYPSIRFIDLSVLELE